MRSEDLLTIEKSTPLVNRRRRPPPEPPGEQYRHAISHTEQKEGLKIN
jgi:hypothetical protein